jgi:hypothetical protein
MLRLNPGLELVLNKVSNHIKCCEQKAMDCYSNTVIPKKIMAMLEGIANRNSDRGSNPTDFIQCSRTSYILKNSNIIVASLES